MKSLFKNDEDLLSESKGFLPEIAGASSAQPGSVVGIPPYPSGAGPTMRSYETAATSQSALKGTQPPSRRRKRKLQEPPPPTVKQSELVRVSGTLLPQGTAR